MLIKYVEIINSNEATINQLNKELKENKKIYKALNRDFEDISSKFSNISYKIINKEGDYKSIHEEYEEKIANFKRDKIRYDDKIKDLLDITQTQKMEIKEHKAKLKINYNEIKTLCKNMANLQNSLSEEKKLNDELKEQLTILNDLNTKFDETSNIIQNLQSELEDEKRQNKELSSENNVIIKITQGLREKLDTLNERYSGENQLDRLHVVIKNKNNDIQKIKNSIDDNKKYVQTIEFKNKQLENEIKELIFGLNLEVSNLNQWVENYLGVYYDNKEIEIPELPCTVTKSTKHKIKLDSLKDSIYNAHLKMITEIEKTKEFLNKFSKESSKNFQIEDNYSNEITELKKEILNKDNDIYILTNKISLQNKEISQLKEENDNHKLEIEGKSEQYNKFCGKINNLLISQLQKVQENPLIINNYAFCDIILKSNFSENTIDIINESLLKYFQIFEKLLSEYELLIVERDKNNVCFLSSQSKDTIYKEKIILYENQLKRKDHIINQQRNEIAQLKENRTAENQLNESLRRTIINNHKESKTFEIHLTESLIKSELNYPKESRKGEFDLNDYLYESKEKNYILSSQNKEQEVKGNNLQSKENNLINSSFNNTVTLKSEVI